MIKRDILLPVGSGRTYLGLEDKAQSCKVSEDELNAELRPQHRSLVRAAERNEGAIAILLGRCSSVQLEWERDA